MKKSRIAAAVPHAESPLRHLPVVDLLVDTKTGLLELALRSGRKVFTTRLEEDRTALCGPRYAHEPERPASRAAPRAAKWSSVAGRSRSSARASGPRPVRWRCRRFRRWPRPIRWIGASWSKMLVGVATRQYARSLEPLGPEMKSRGTSKSAGSRRFVARTTAQLVAWQSAPLDALGIWDGSTENATVCQGLLANLQSRGLRNDAACS